MCLELLGSRSNEETQYLYEMAEVDRIELGGKLYIVDVFADEGEDVPHFHLHPKGGRKKDDIVIRIDVPEYFLHGSYSRSLNSKEKKELIAALNSEYDGESLWEAIRRGWNRLHRDKRVDLGIPDYSELPGKK